MPELLFPLLYDTRVKNAAITRHYPDESCVLVQPVNGLLVLFSRHRLPGFDLLLVCQLGVHLALSLTGCCSGPFSFFSLLNPPVFLPSHQPVPSFPLQAHPFIYYLSSADSLHPHPHPCPSLFPSRTSTFSPPAFQPRQVLPVCVCCSLCHSHHSFSLPFSLPHSFLSSALRPSHLCHSFLLLTFILPFPLTSAYAVIAPFFSSLRHFCLGSTRLPCHVSFGLL